MVFQIQGLKLRIAIALIVSVLVLIMPASADLVNGYYKVAPNISQGSTVFIGEEGLDISDALAAANAAGTPTNLSTIGWWAWTDVYNTRLTISYSLINRSTQFNVSQAEFDSYTGDWYLVDPDNNNHAKLGTGPVFTIRQPVVQLNIWNPTRNGGVDISNRSASLGTRLQFQIITDLNTVLATPSLRSPVYNRTGSGVNSDGFLDIKVRYENGTIFTNLSDDNNLAHTLIGLNVSTQPYIWGGANGGMGPDTDYEWNTHSYPQGAYYVSAQSNLNNMFNNYRSGGAAYTGRTVSEIKTIVLVKDSTQIRVFRPANGNWYFDTSKNGAVTKTFHFGTLGDIPVVGNWDGNGRGSENVVLEIGVFRPANGNWYLDYNKSGTVSKTFHFGTMGDIPVVGDWNKNGMSDIGVFRPANGNWYLAYNETGVVDTIFHFGTMGDIPVVGDWDGNGMPDIGVFRPASGNWYLDTTRTGVVNTTFHFGISGDIPVVGDWDGNGISDIGVFRPANGNWYLDYNKTGVVDTTFHFGTSGDIPVIGDWDGNEISDIGVFRPANGNWYLDYNKTGVVDTTFHFGTIGDAPVTDSTHLISQTPQPSTMITFTSDLRIMPGA